MARLWYLVGKSLAQIPNFVMFQSIEVEEILNAKFKSYSYIRKNEMKDFIDIHSQYLGIKVNPNNIFY